MDDALLARVEAEVLRRLSLSGPPALLLGSPPPDTLGYRTVDGAPYDAVLIGALSAAQLLTPDERILDALLAGKPVYLWEGGLSYRQHQKTANRVLWSRLQAAERQLLQWGVRFYGGGQSRRLVTAQDAQLLRSQHKSIPPGAVLTPLAREILEGKAP